MDDSSSQRHDYSTSSVSLVDSSVSEGGANTGMSPAPQPTYHTGSGRRGSIGSFVKKVMGRRSSQNGSTTGGSGDHHHHHSTSENESINGSNHSQSNNRDGRNSNLLQKAPTEKKKKRGMLAKSTSWKLNPKAPSLSKKKTPRRAKSHSSEELKKNLQGDTPTIYYERTSTRKLMEDASECKEDQMQPFKRDPLSLKNQLGRDEDSENDDDAFLFDTNVTPTSAASGSHTSLASPTKRRTITTVTTTTTSTRVPGPPTMPARNSTGGLATSSTKSRMSMNPTEMAHNLLVVGPTGAMQKAAKMVTNTGKLASNAVEGVVGGGKLIVEGTTDTLRRGGGAVVGGGKAFVEGTTHTLVYGGKTVVGGGKAIVEGTTNTLVYGGQTVLGGGKAIVEGTTNTLVYGGKTVVGGGKAIVEGTTNVSRQVVAGTGRAFGGAVKGLRKPFHFRTKQKTQWEEGVSVIDELLDPESDAYGVITEQQRMTLASVKKILLKGPAGGNRAQHIPRELIDLQSMGGLDIDDDLTGIDTLDYASMHELGQGRTPAEIRQNTLRGSQHSIAMRRNSNFILQEYAGVKDGKPLLDGFDDDSDSCGEFEDPGSSFKPAQGGAAPAAVSPGTYCPPEFTNLAPEHKMELTSMLTWKSINQWGFDIFRLHDLTQGHPLLFMGWAVLGAPYSQQAMATEAGMYDQIDASEGYKFVDLLKIPMEKLCNYVRAIESDYNSENPYHNATHASDVLQSLHFLIQKALEEEFMQGSSRINIFAILLAAIVHDCDHPGKTNAFHVQLKSELAVMYNDRSVLENWHAAHAFARMLDLDLSKTGSNPAMDLQKKNFRGVDSKNNILCNATPEQFRIIRKHVIDAVLHTDMTSHFESVNAAKGMLLEAAEDEDGMKNEDRTWRLLMFTLHLADISGQAKEAPFFLKWTDRCMDEFFKQGDEEFRLGLSISPNCDRNTTIPAVSQMGFIQFVIEPAFQVLGNYIPFVQEQVVPIIHDNMEYWARQQENTQGEPANEEKLETLTE